ncbi:MAG: pyridoxal phosphate-dependent aminotransferase [Candidatus Hodarchaeota archaeon]
MPYEAKKLSKIRPSGIRKIFDLAQGMEGVISLGLGAPDFSTPEPLIEAMIKALKDGYTSYSPNLGYLELREQIVKKYQDEYNLNYESDEICITCGAAEALLDVFLAFLNPKDEVLIPDPGFLTYPAQVILAGGIPKPYPLFEKHDFKIDANNLNELITPKTKMIVLNFPSNPTGAVMEEKELNKVAKIAEDNDLLVFSDECYEKLIYDGLNHVCLASLGIQDRTIVVNSFSKTFSMTGWRIGYIVAKLDLMKSIFKTHQMNTACANSAAQIAVLKGLKSSQDFSTDMVKEFDNRRKIIVNGLNKIPGIKCFMPKGAFYAFPNINGTGMTSPEFSEFLIEKVKVATVPGNEFGDYGEGYIRLAYTVSVEKLSEALDRISHALSEK